MRRTTVAAGLAALLSLAIAVEYATPVAAALFNGPAAKAACEAAVAVYGPANTGEELSACQWDMRRINAGPASYAKATGRGVKVGVIDGGVDFTHPDLAGAIDVALACSFIFDDTPTADPTEIANGDCSNKAAVQDLQGHGTHVSTTIAGRVNGFGIAGVAPEATIVGLKACTIAGYCFADSVAAALRYAGDQRLDVVNLSLFADPWLYNCHNAADQRAILLDLQSAARYAQQRGVVVVASAGNELDDLGHPGIDDISPDWPPGAAVEREVGNECWVAPAELPGVITVSATGVTQLASYSNSGSPVEVTAPGGDAPQTVAGVFGRGRILAGWSSTDQTGTWEALVAANRAVVSGGGRYVWISGTSMSSPHAAGVAALVKQLHPRWNTGAVAAALARTATPMACPTNWPADDPRQCTGDADQNSFYGAGMVNALGAASI
jgi:lantibiotic leader peptide-processing serine protease